MSKSITAPVRRYHRIDGWRGYIIPATAIVGGSYTGEWADSPARGLGLAQEINRYRREVLRPLGIKSRGVWGTTSNVFCCKRWVTVERADFARAAEASLAWLNAHDDDLRYLHHADLIVKTREAA